MILINSCGYLFGKPENLPEIMGALAPHGFYVTAKRDEWMKAEGKRRTWYIRETSTHWILDAQGTVHTRLASKARRDVRSWCDDLRQSSCPEGMCVREDVYSLAIKKGDA